MATHPENTISQGLLNQVGQLLGEFGVPEAIRGSGALHYLGDIVSAQASTLGFKDGFLIMRFMLLQLHMDTNDQNRLQKILRLKRKTNYWR